MVQVRVCASSAAARYARCGVFAPIGAFVRDFCRASRSTRIPLCVCRKAICSRHCKPCIISDPLYHTQGVRKPHRFETRINRERHTSGVATLAHVDDSLPITVLRPQQLRIDSLTRLGARPASVWTRDHQNYNGRCTRRFASCRCYCSWLAVGNRDRN